MKLKVLYALSCAFVLFATAEAAFTFQDGKIIEASEAATMAVKDHFAAGVEAIEACDWGEASCQFTIVTKSFPGTSYAQEAYYYLGVAYFYLEEYDYSNDAFTEYLKAQSNPRYFQETIQYKFMIAEKLAGGAKRRFFGTKRLPKWASGESLALTIYDEVIAAVPCHEIAAQALVSKGCLLLSMKDYHQSVEAFQLVIRRFPKHELAPECYLLISQVYLMQSRFEFQNPDIIAFAQLNLRRFQRDFPREERLCQVEEDVLAIKEIYAQGLYDTGRFYERTRKRRAAIIYYYNAIQQFPDTCVADLCRKRVAVLDPCYVDNSFETPSKQEENQLEPFNEDDFELSDG